MTQDTLGATIQNSQNIAVNGQLNFVNLYNKFKYLKNINDKSRGRGGKSTRSTSAKPTAKDSIPEKEPIKIDILEGLARILMVIRNGTVTYSQNSGILLPGYDRRTNAFGMDDFSAPGFGFVTGQQNHDLSGNIARDFATNAASRGWLVQTPSIFSPYTNTRTETINARLSLEPFRGFRIELSANRTIADNRSSFFRWNEQQQSYVDDSPREYGNYSVSMLTWRTAFAADNENFVNQVFEEVLNNRPIISARLGVNNINSVLETDSGFYSGYGSTNQDVVLPAFLAAYTGRMRYVIWIYSSRHPTELDIRMMAYEDPSVGRMFRTLTIRTVPSNSALQLPDQLLYVPGSAEGCAETSYPNVRSR